MPLISQTDPAARVNWVMNERSRTATLPSHAPVELSEQCLSLLDHLGLAYGALDFVLGNDNQYTFLEVNPNGEWLWLEDKLDYPISDEIADWLTGRVPQA